MDPKIINYINELPWHPKKRWSKRKFSDIKKVVIHQTASPANTTGSKDIFNINNYFIKPGNHVSATGCPHFCYHVAIDDDGTIYWCNEFTDVTWHVRGYNTESIGIVLIGSFDGPTFKGKDGKPTDAQINSLIKVLNSIILNLFELKKIKKEDVFGHTNLDPISKENCPGTIIMQILQQWKTS